MKNQWSVISALIALIFSVGIAAAQSEPALASPDEQAERAASRDVATLTRVSVHPEKEGMSVEITCSRPITPTPTMINDPSRLVLDFADTISANPQNRINVNQDGLKSVRIGVQPVDPPTTRVVLDLEQSRAYQLVPDGNKLTVKLGQVQDEIPSAAPESNAGAGQQISSAVAPGSTPESSAAPQSPAAIPMALAQASPEAPAAEAAPNGKPSATAQEANSSAATKADVAQTAAAEAAPVPKTGDADAGKTAAAPADAAKPAAIPQQAADSIPTAPVGEQIAKAIAPTNNSDAANADKHSGAPEVPEQAKPSQDSSAPQAKPSAVANDPAPQPPAAQPLSLSAAKVAPSVPDASAKATQPTVAVQPTPSDYVIGEQDMLSIVVWKERELSGTVVVRPDGKITLPLVNEIKVVGMTPAQLQSLLTEQLKPFLNIPQVTVEVVQINSRKAYLIGEVQRTGTFPLNSSTTVLQIIAQAGGLRDFAKRKDIYILRTQNGKQTRYRFNYDEVIKGKNTQQNIVLQPGDMVVVP